MKRKKILAWMLAGTMLATTYGGYASATQESGFKRLNMEEPTEITDMVKEERNAIFGNNVAEGETPYDEDFEQLIYDPEQEVRIIVELEEAPVETTEELKGKQKSLEKKQNKVKEDIESAGVKGDFRHSYYMGVNGFSMETKYKNVETIEELPEVKEVTVVRTFEPAMQASKDIMNTTEVWDELELKGEGVVVAVVDSGVDYTHKDMTLGESGLENAKLTEENLQEIFDETDVDEEFFTDKVPTGYDWADRNSNVIPASDAHGTHVAGIVGANGDESADGVMGIAPEAQIIAEKVFSDYNSYAYEDDIIAGILHAVEVGADVINMSLGSPSGYVDEEYDFVQKAIRNASEQGVLVVVSAGNEAYSTLNSIPFPQSALPFAENYDIGVSGAPGVGPYALQVASYENDSTRVDAMTLNNDGKLGYLQKDNVDILTELGDGVEYELVYVGKGLNSDYKNLDVEGKIAVVDPGDTYSILADFQRAADRNGAKGVIYVPTEAQGDYALGWGMSYLSNFMPIVCPALDEGNDIIERLQNGEELTISFSDDSIWVNNNTASNMSVFSSWGTPHDLSFKPEITAPGGRIYSTVLNDEYATYSGTSMSAPHVAGGAALVVQALKESGEENSLDMVMNTKTMIMNTADIIYNPEVDDEVPYSPRKQGSGMMQIDDAINTPAFIYTKHDSAEKAASVELKEITGNKAKFNLVLEALEGENIPDEMEYEVYIDILTDEVVTAEYDNTYDGEIDKVVDVLTMNSVRVEGAQAKVNGKRISDTESTTVSVKAGKTTNLNFEIDLSKATNLNENSFLEGFVRLEPVNSDIPSLTMPYMGFYGDWTAQNNIDPSVYDVDDRFLVYTALWDEANSYPLGLVNSSTAEVDIETIGVSPKAYLPGVYPTFTVMRNINDLEIYVEDESGNKVYEVLNAKEMFDGDARFAKNIMYRNNYSYSLRDAWELYWKGTDDEGNILPDGNYTYVIKSTLDYEGAEPQYTRMPVKIASVAPEVKNVEIEELWAGAYQVSWDVEEPEHGVGYSGAEVYVNGTAYPFYALGGETSVTVYTNEPVEGLLIGVFDNATNLRYTTWGEYEVTEELIAYSRADAGNGANYENPVQITAFANMIVDWTISILDSEDNVVDSTTIEQESEFYNLVWYPEKGLADGEYKVKIELVDQYGFYSSKTRTFNIVDNGGETEEVE